MFISRAFVFIVKMGLTGYNRAIKKNKRRHPYKRCGAAQQKGAAKYMYYSAGTYEAFAHPEKPQGVDNKSAYIIGTGLAGLTAAFYLVRDGQMKGERVHLL